MQRQGSGAFVHTMSHRFVFVMWRVWPLLHQVAIVATFDRLQNLLKIADKSGERYACGTQPERAQFIR